MYQTWTAQEMPCLTPLPDSTCAPGKSSQISSENRAAKILIDSTPFLLDGKEQQSKIKISSSALFQGQTEQCQLMSEILPHTVIFMIKTY